MTGFYVRVLRDGEWQNIEIEQLQASEFDEFEQLHRKESPNNHAEQGWRWAKVLAAWIRVNVKEGREP